MTKSAGRNIEKLQEGIQRHIPYDELDRLLWPAIEDLAGCPFQTFKGLKFFYEVKGKEIFITRKEKSITYSSVVKAFHVLLDREGMITGPKQLGTFGASYLYPVFESLGLIRKS